MIPPDQVEEVRAAIASSRQQIHDHLPVFREELDDLLGAPSGEVAAMIQGATHRQRLLLGRLACHALLEAYAGHYAPDAASTTTSTVATAPPAPPA